MIFHIGGSKGDTRDNGLASEQSTILAYIYMHANLLPTQLRREYHIDQDNH